MDSKSSINNQMENAIEQGLRSLFRSFSMGIRALKNKANFIVFFITAGVCISIVIYLGDYHYLLGLPLVFIWFVGVLEVTSCERIESQLGNIKFIGRDQKIPKLLKQYAHPENPKITVMLFKSYIPLYQWQDNLKLLETAFNRSVVGVQEFKGSKQKIEIYCLPPGHKLPEKTLWNDKYVSAKSGVVTVGEDDLGAVSFNLNKTPHIIAAGETGSGKSVILRTILWQLICQSSRVYMIDFKGGVEFGLAYERYGEVVTDRKRALQILDMLVKENEKRLRLFRKTEVKNLDHYNAKYGKNLCRVGVVIDEIAEMLDKKGATKENKELMEQLEGRISTLARLSRATGINLIIGVQRPDANVLPGQIKNNIPIRICGRFSDKTASDIVLGNTMAVTLPAIQGRFMYKIGADTKPFQAYYFDDDTMLKKRKFNQGDLLIERRKNKTAPVKEKQLRNV